MRLTVRRRAILPKLLCTMVGTASSSGVDMWFNNENHFSIYVFSLISFFASASHRHIITSLHSYYVSHPVDQAPQDWVAADSRWTCARCWFLQRFCKVRRRNYSAKILYNRPANLCASTIGRSQNTTLYLLWYQTKPQSCRCDNVWKFEVRLRGR
jgi:hypothetical protein